MVSAAVHFKTVILLFLIHFLCWPNFMWGFCVWSLLSNIVFSFLSSFAFTLLRKRELSRGCLCSVPLPRSAVGLPGHFLVIHTCF